MSTGDSLGNNWFVSVVRPDSGGHPPYHGSELKRTSTLVDVGGHYQAIHEPSGAQLQAGTPEDLQASVDAWVSDQLARHDNGLLGEAA